MMRRTLLLLTLVALPACDRFFGAPKAPDAGVPDAGPPVLVEKEPNDSAAQALVLSGTATVDANLSADPARPDSDWYALTASAPSTVDVEVTPPAGGDVALELVDEAGGVLASVNAGGVGGVERIPNVDVSARTYVRVVATRKGVGGAYTLRATFQPRAPGYELEPNERKADATAVGLGQAISGTVGNPGDIDWYRYELGEPEAPPEPLLPADEQDAGAEDAGVNPLAEKRVALRIGLSALEGVATHVQLLTEAEAVLFEARSRENGTLSLRNVGVRAADRVVYVAVRSANKKANPDTSYTLTVGRENDGDNAELEPNDELTRATDVPPNSYRDGYLSPKGDVDHFRLVTDGPSIVSLQVSGVDKVDLVLAVVRPVEGKPDEVVARANEGTSREDEQLTNIACDGVCFIRVEAASKKVDGKWVKEDENGDQPYRLTTTVVPDDGSVERESNNTAATATPVTLGRAIRGTVFPKKDVDYYALDLRERPVKTALVGTVTGLLKVDVGLYLHRVEDDGKLTLVQTADGARGEKSEVVRFTAEPGLYVFEVRDARNREANFQDSYQLTVDEGD